MRISDDRYHRDVQRYSLALRMISLDARTHTICEWTGLSPDRVRNLHQSYSGTALSQPRSRPRGSSPHQVTRYLRTGHGKSEAAAMMGLCITLEVLPVEPLKNPRRELPSVARGERLCKAYEIFQTVVPNPTLTFEQAVLLLTAVAIGSEVCIAHCDSCDAVMLSNPDGFGDWRCKHCGSGAQAPPRAALST